MHATTVWMRWRSWPRATITASARIRAWGHGPQSFVTTRTSRSTTEPSTPTGISSSCPDRITRMRPRPPAFSRSASPGRSIGTCRSRTRLKTTHPRAFSSSSTRSPSYAMSRARRVDASGDQIESLLGEQVFGLDRSSEDLLGDGMTDEHVDHRSVRLDAVGEGISRHLHHALVEAVRRRRVIDGAIAEALKVDALGLGKGVENRRGEAGVTLKQVVLHHH